MYTPVLRTRKRVPSGVTAQARSTPGLSEGLAWGPPGREPRTVLAGAGRVVSSRPTSPWWEASPRLTDGTAADGQAVAPESGAQVQAAAVCGLRVWRQRAGWGSGQGCHGQGGPEDALAGAEQPEDDEEAAPFMLEEQDVPRWSRVVQGPQCKEHPCRPPPPQGSHESAQRRFRGGTSGRQPHPRA